MSKKTTGTGRILALDGFRALAILSVILFHYFSHEVFFAEYYPYHDKYNYFHYGALGVHFFFIISGFVISYTLTRTTDLVSFAKKRFIRLYPSLFIAAIFIFLLFYCLQLPNFFADASSPANLVSSLSFIPPAFFNKLFHLNPEMYYINGSFWSLWPEIQFYIFSSVVYYWNPAKFFRNFSIIIFVFICTNWLISNIAGSNYFSIALPQQFLQSYMFLSTSIFNLSIYLVFFTAGFMFFTLYDLQQQNRSLPAGFLPFFAFILSFMIYWGIGWQNRVGIVIMIILFFLFLYKPNFVKLFSNKWLVKIGYASYFIYLIHEPIGVLLINKLVTDNLVSVITVVPLVTGFIILLGFLYTKYIDSNIAAYLKKVLSKPRYNY